MAAVLMTAAVLPQPAFVGRASTPLDPEIRRKEYARAVAHYICEPGFKDIVFCENTGASLAFLEHLIPLAAKHNKRLELLGFHGDPVTIQRFGYYGCGDAEIIDHAYATSRLLHDHSAFYKVTGRYILQKPARVISVIGSRDDFFCHDGYRPFLKMGSALLEVMTAFFKVSHQTYERHLFNKVMPLYETLYRHPNVKQLFPTNYPCILLEQVYYLLLRRFLRDKPLYRYVPIVFEHWQLSNWSCAMRNMILSTSRLDQFHTMHWIADSLFSSRFIASSSTEIEAD